MTNDQKAELYDDLVHKGGILERKNSQLKAQYAFNMQRYLNRELAILPFAESELNKIVAKHVGDYDKFLKHEIKYMSNDTQWILLINITWNIYALALHL